MKRIAWAGPAAQDFHDIVDHLNHEPFGGAASSIDQVDAAVKRVAAHPRRGRVVAELERHNVTQYREAIVPPWRLIYRVEGDRVVMMAVIDGRRNVEDILLRRLVRGSS